MFIISLLLKYIKYLYLAIDTVAEKSFKRFILQAQI